MVFRFITNCKHVLPKVSGPIQASEFQNAEYFWIKRAQEQFGNKGEIQASNGKLASLCPSIDEDGIIRANTRLVNANFLNFNTKYPMFFV